MAGPGHTECVLVFLDRLRKSSNGVREEGKFESVHSNCRSSILSAPIYPDRLQGGFERRFRFRTSFDLLNIEASMRRSWRLLSLAGAIATAICFVGFTFLLRKVPREQPAYGGKPIRFWVSQLSSESALSSQTIAAEDALKRIGTNALAFILEELRLPDSSKVTAGLWDGFKHSKFARKTSGLHIPYQEPASRRRQAAHGLSVLATQIEMGTLTNLVHDENEHVRNAAAEAVLGYDKPGVDALLQIIGSGKENAALAALQALPNASYIPREIDPLVECLANSNASVRQRAIVCMSQFAPLLPRNKCARIA